LEIPQMKRAAVVLILGAAMLGTAGPAMAKGCIKGAIVGGVAGHYGGHHGTMGAIAGCAIGRHEANKRDRDRRQDPQQQDSSNTRH
jgi:hypothetical protein